MIMVMNEEDYQRGHLAGEIAARLADHDQHFSDINGSIKRFSDEVHQLTMAIQHLGDQAISRDATVLTTALALKDAEEARRASSESSWSPVARISTVLGAAAALAALLSYLISR
jgi:hypothetical protein